jgi:hypothetical protein
VEAVRALRRPGAFLYPVPTTAYGALVLRRDLFIQSGGYDDMFQGWGGEDDEFKRRLRLGGLVDLSFPGDLVHDIHHEDSERVAHYALADLEASRAINLLYLTAKLDLLRVTGRVDDALRRDLYRACRARVMDAEPGATAKPLEVGCKQTRVGPWLVKTSLTFSLVRDEETSPA